MNSPNESPEASLVRGIGVWGLAASIVNITVGGGIFRLPALVALSLGPSAPLAYLVCAVIMGLVVLCIAEAGSRVGLTGGPYAYLEVAFGPFVGFLSGILLWLVGTFAWAAVAGVFAANATSLFPAVQKGIGAGAVLVVVFVLLCAVNVAGVGLGTRLNAFTAVAKLLPLGLLLIFGAFGSTRANLAWTDVPGASAVARTSAVLIFAFCGIETALVPSGEVKDVVRTIPRAIAIAMGTVTLLYIALQLVAQGVMGSGLAHGGMTPLAEVAADVMGPAGRTLLLGGAALSMFGYLSGMTLAVPRTLFAFARDGFLPGAFSRIHPRFRTPYVAIVVQSTIVCVLALTSTFERLAILANLSILIVYGLCCVAVFELRRKDVRAGGIPFQVPAPKVVPLLACAGILWLLTTIQKEEWAAVALCLCGASALFGLTRAVRSWSSR